MQYESQTSVGQKVIINGERVASVTTDDGKRPRWTELNIYETYSGIYVLEEIGRTVAFKEDPNGVPMEEIPNHYIPAPGTDLSAERFTPEKDMFSVSTFDSVMMLIDTGLRQTNGRFTGPSQSIVAQLKEKYNIPFEREVIEL